MARSEPVTPQELVVMSEKLQEVIDEVSTLSDRLRDTIGKGLQIEPEFLTKVFTAVHDIAELGRTASILARDNARAGEIEAKLKR